MAVTSYQDLPLTDRDREWDGAVAERRVRQWAGVDDEPNEKYRDAHVWYDAEKKQNFTAYKRPKYIEFRDDLLEWQRQAIRWQRGWLFVNGH